MKDFQTSTLTAEEVANPHLVIDEVFELGHLPDLKEYLWTWLKMTVSGSYNSEEITTLERSDIIIIYEKIERLIEAAWVLKKRIAHYSIDSEL